MLASEPAPGQTACEECGQPLVSDARRCPECDDLPDVAPSRVRV